MSKRAAIYVRVSTDKQSESVDNQRNSLQQVAQRRGWDVVEVSIPTKASRAPRAATSALRSMPCSMTPAEGSSTSSWRGPSIAWVACSSR